MAKRSLRKSFARLITNWIMMHLAPRIERRAYQIRNKILNEDKQRR